MLYKLRGDYAYLDNAAGDQAGNTEEFQYRVVTPTLTLEPVLMITV